jgi:hypothetical protein
MGVLDQVTDLKNKGFSEREIANSLKEQGFAPKMIDDALSQAKIKSAVSAPEETGGGMEPSIMRPERAETLPTEGMGPSEEDLTPPPSISRIPAAAQRGFAPMTQEMSEEEYVPKPQRESTSQPQRKYAAPSQEEYPAQQEEYAAPSQEEYAPPQEEYVPKPQTGAYSYPQYQSQEYSPAYAPQEYAPPYQAQEYYPQEGYGYSGAEVSVGNTDMMIEISEQVFFEKVKSIQKQLQEFNEFKTLTQTKVENISSRLKRIEASIDRLQSAILEKVGSYGRGLDNVKKEMSMMQGSFGKMVNTLAKKTERPHVMHKSPQVVHKKPHVIHKTEKKTTVVHHKARKKSSRRR